MADDYGTTSIGGGKTGAASGALSGAAAGFAVGGPIGAVAGALLGGIFGKKKTKVPNPPSYGKLMKNTLSSQRDIQGQLLSYESEYRPMYQSLAEETYNRQLYGGQGTEGYLNMLERLQGGVAGVERRAALQNMEMMGELAPMARDAMLSQNQKSMIDMITSRAMSRGLSGELSSEETRSAQQSARAAMASRGLTGRQAVAAEVLNMESATLNREARNRQELMSALQLETGMQDSALKHAMSGLSSAAARGQFIGASGFLGETQPRIFEPESQMAAQLAGMKYQQGMQVAQSKMAQQQGLMQSIGSLGTMAMMNPGMFSSIGGLFSSSAPAAGAAVGTVSGVPVGAGTGNLLSGGGITMQGGGGLPSGGFTFY
jgi:hypothetical protein